MVVRGGSVYDPVRFGLYEPVREPDRTEPGENSHRLNRTEPNRTACLLFMVRHPFCIARRQGGRQVSPIELARGFGRGYGTCGTLAHLKLLFLFETKPEQRAPATTRHASARNGPGGMEEGVAQGTIPQTVGGVAAKASVASASNARSQALLHHKWRGQRV